MDSFKPIIAKVANRLQASTTKAVSASLRCRSGTTEEIARAAEAPQMAVAPPAKTP
jgi:hypothetical protein